MVQSVKENTKGREREGGLLPLVRFSQDLFYIYTFPLYPLASILAIQIGLIMQWGNSCHRVIQLLLRQHTAVF